MTLSKTLLLATLMMYATIGVAQAQKPRASPQSLGPIDLLCKRIAGAVVDVWAAKVPFEDCSEVAACAATDDYFVVETVSAYSSERVQISRVSGVATTSSCSMGLDIDRGASKADSAKKALEHCSTRWTVRGQMQCEKASRKF